MLCSWIESRAEAVSSGPWYAWLHTCPASTCTNRTRAGSSTSICSDTCDSRPQDSQTADWWTLGCQGIKKEMKSVEHEKLQHVRRRETDIGCFFTYTLRNGSVRHGKVKRKSKLTPFDFMLFSGDFDPERIFFFPEIIYILSHWTKTFWLYSHRA